MGVQLPGGLECGLPRDCWKAACKKEASGTLAKIEKNPRSLYPRFEALFDTAFDRLILVGHNGHILGSHVDAVAGCNFFTADLTQHWRDEAGPCDIHGGKPVGGPLTGAMAHLSTDLLGILAPPHKTLGDAESARERSEIDSWPGCRPPTPEPL